MSIATLAGKVVSRARVTVPAWGLPWADVDMPDPGDVALTGRQTLVLADVSISCTVQSGGISNGRAAYRLVAGAGGWGTVVDAKSYTNDLGVKLATVARNVAEACGETIADAPDTRLGPHYARANTTASLVLHELAARAWYVGFDGVTRFGSRPTAAYAGSAARTRVEPALGVIELATESLAGIVPGVTVDGSLPATDVEYTLDADRLTARVYTGRRTSRRLQAFAGIMAALDPRARYRGKYEFRVVTQSGDRLALQPVRVASGFDFLSNVPIRMGVPGVRSNLLLGTLVLVEFVDADPSRPVVTGFDAPDAPGWHPLTLEFGGPGALGVARLTDAVVCGPFGGAITFASTTVKSGL